MPRFDRHAFVVALWACIAPLALASTGCMTAYKKSVGSETAQVFQRIYLTDFNTSW
jgi:hypothetical protein